MATMTTKQDSLFIPQLTMFLLFFGFTMNVTAMQLMVLDKVCHTNGYEDNICQHLHQHPEVEDEVQAKASAWTLILPLLSFMPAAIMTLFLGPLSDIYGRKNILLIPVVTGAISSLAMLIQSQQELLSASLLYGANLLVGLGGGLGTFMSTLISYVTDATQPERRTERLSMLLPFLAVGQTVGTLFSGFLWEQSGASAIFLITFLANIIIIISLMFLKENPKQSDDSKVHDSGFTLGTFLRSSTAGFRVVSASRPNGRRRKLLMLLIVGPASIFFSSADITIVSLCLRRAPFQWTPSLLSYFIASKTVAVVLGTALLVPLYIRITGVRSIQGDLTVMCISYISAALMCLVMVGASTSLHLLITPVLFASIGAVGPVTRSLSSKLVNSSEIGALNGFTSFLNNMAAAVGSSLIVSLYTNTVHTFPGASYLAVMAVMVVCFLIMLVLKREYGERPESEDKTE